APVEGEDQQGAEMLAQGMFDDQRLELWNGFLVQPPLEGGVGPVPEGRAGQKSRRAWSRDDSTASACSSSRSPSARPRQSESASSSFARRSGASSASASATSVSKRRTSRASGSTTNREPDS